MSFICVGYFLRVGGEGEDEGEVRVRVRVWVRVRVRVRVSLDRLIPSYLRRVSSLLKGLVR
jgi:hypothetical protein